MTSQAGGDTLIMTCGIGKCQIGCLTFQPVSSFGDSKEGKVHILCEHRRGAVCQKLKLKKDQSTPHFKCVML